jgi:hypothetical protein
VTRFLALTALCLVVAACGGAVGEGATAASGGPAAAMRSTATAESPSWFGGRSELPTCGVDEPFTDGYPNRDARTCFRQAFEAGRPAELTRVSYGDEGEWIRAHFRVLGDGRYEIVAQQFPSSVADYAAGHGWVRYDCERFVFLDSPGAEVDGVPWINGEGECHLVEYVEG